MGMGEPLLNWEAVDGALTISTTPTAWRSGAAHYGLDGRILPSLAKLAQRRSSFAWRSHSMRHTGAAARLMPTRRVHVPRSWRIGAIPSPRDARVRAHEGKNDALEQRISWRN